MYASELGYRRETICARKEESGDSEYMRWKTLLDKAGDCLKGGSVTLYNADTVTVRRRICAQGASDKRLRYEQESLVNSR